MKYKILICLICILCALGEARASHLIGGVIEYECLNPATNTYSVTLKLWRDCTSSTPFESDIYIYTQNATGTSYINTVGSASNTNYILLSNPIKTTLPVNINDPCVSVPNVCVEQAIYNTTAVINVPATGLQLVYQRCCRNGTIVNIDIPGDVGATYTTMLPPPADAPCNSNPIFNNFPPIVICANSALVFDHSAVDADGDVLVYSLCDPFTGASPSGPIVSPPSVPGPYPPVSWTGVYNTSNMLGGTTPLTINPTTGLLTGYPTTIGQFVVGVCVSEYRGGVLINTTKRDFQFNVTDCEPLMVAATPSLTYECQDFTVHLVNNSYGVLPIDSVMWDMGDPTTTSDILYTYNADYTYPDSGVYTVTLIINPQLSCGDTTVANVAVYPTLTAQFSHSGNACIGDVVAFTDLSTTTYGVIDQWNWNFGDGQGSALENPTHAYNTAGDYTVTLTVTTNKGCSLSQNIPISIASSSPLTVSNDTSICNLDTISLWASGSATYTWAPSAGMSGSNTSTPAVSPDVTTTYTVSSTNSSGCPSVSFVTVTVLPELYLNVTGNPVICLGDGIQLNTDYPYSTSFSWTPKTASDYQISDILVLHPNDTTNYTITVHYGNCSASDDFLVTPIMPPVILGNDSLRICPGDTVQVSLSGADMYKWLTTDYISNTTISNPLLFPETSTDYIIEVYNNDTCSLRGYDTLHVEVVDFQSEASADETTIYNGEQTLLHASEGTSWFWYNEAYMDDITLQNPTAFPDHSMNFYVKSFSEEGCTDFDTVRIEVIDPGFFVPSAFSPNGDGINDFFQIYQKDIELVNFCVYSRWGEKLFETQNLNTGWDGTFKGKKVQPGVFIYTIEYKDVISKTKLLKGNFTLLK